jgi:hypothetical protein
MLVGLSATIGSDEWWASNPFVANQLTVKFCDPSTLNWMLKRRENSDSAVVLGSFESVQSSFALG